MKLVICFVVFVAGLALVKAQGPIGGPPAGWLIGQQASAGAVNFAIDSALAKSVGDTSTLSPELQVSQKG